jgi:hypothetical protein
VETKAIVPLSELPENFRKVPFVKLRRYDEPLFTLIFPMRYGKVLDIDKFEMIFGRVRTEAQMKAIEEKEEEKKS